MPKVKQRAEYDQKKSYTWSPDIEITLSGREFEAIVNAIGIANSIIQNTFIEGVKEGIITEAVSQETIEDVQASLLNPRNFPPQIHQDIDELHRSNY